MPEKQAVLPKPYRYRLPSRRIPRFDVNRLPRLASAIDPKPLTGYVNGLAATDIEERFARALRSHKHRFQYQVPFSTPAAFGGRTKIVDFVVWGGVARAHTTFSSNQGRDRSSEGTPFPSETADFVESGKKQKRDITHTPIRYPVEIYGKIAHEGSANQGHDKVRETLLNETFRQQGLQPMQVVWYWQLETQELADRKVRTMFA